MRVPKSILSRVAPAKPNRRALSLYLPYPPSANVLWRCFNGRNILSEAGRAYKKRVASAIPPTTQPVDGPVAIEVFVWRPRRSGDLENRLKATLDAIQGFAYHNDNQITEIHAYRRDAAGNGGVVLHVRPDEKQAEAESTAALAESRQRQFRRAVK